MDLETMCRPAPLLSMPKRRKVSQGNKPRTMTKANMLRQIVLRLTALQVGKNHNYIKTDKKRRKATQDKDTEVRKRLIPKETDNQHEKATAKTDAKVRKCLIPKETGNKHEKATTNKDTDLKVRKALSEVRLHAVQVAQAGRSGVRGMGSRDVGH